MGGVARPEMLNSCKTNYNLGMEGRSSNVSFDGRGEGGLDPFADYQK